VLSQSLPQPDSMIQAVDVLAQLNSIAEQMFIRLRDKAETQKRIIDSITARINTASTKAAQLRKDTGKSTVVISPASYPKQNPTHYQNVFTPLPSKPDIVYPSLYTAPSGKGELNKLKKVSCRRDPLFDEPAENDIDLSFSIIEQHQQYSVKKNLRKENSHVYPYSSVDELITFGQQSKHVKKQRKPNKPYKNKDDIDPLIWDDFMSTIKRDPGLNFVPGFNNFPVARNLPDHLMAPNVATNISFFNDKTVDNTIAPTLYLNLPEVGIKDNDKSTLPQPNNQENPVPLSPTPHPNNDSPQLKIQESPGPLPPTPSQNNQPDRSSDRQPQPLPKPSVKSPTSTKKVDVEICVVPKQPVKNPDPQGPASRPVPVPPPLPPAPDQNTRPSGFIPPPPPPPCPSSSMTVRRPARRTEPRPQPPPTIDDLNAELLKKITSRRVYLEEEPTNNTNTNPQELDEWNE